MSSGRKFSVKILPGENANNFSVPRIQQGGKKRMFYCGIFGLGKAYFSTLEGNIDSKFFSGFLKGEVLPVIRSLYKNTFILQQDNAPAHKRYTLAVIKEEDVKSITWPLQSPDLNPVEQVWLWMSHQVGSMLFKNVEELEEFIFDLREIAKKYYFILYKKKYKTRQNGFWITTETCTQIISREFHVLYIITI